MKDINDQIRNTLNDNIGTQLRNKIKISNELSRRFIWDRLRVEPSINLFSNLEVPIWGQLSTSVNILP